VPWLITGAASGGVGSPTNPFSLIGEGKMANLWFRFYSEFEDDPKVQMMPEVMQLRLVKVFCGRCKEVKLTDAQLAYKWHITATELAETKALFIENGFIDEHWEPLNWNKRQYLSDSSTIRTKRYRERKRTSQERHGDVHSVTRVTKCDGLDTEEIRREQSRLEEKRRAAATGKPRGNGALLSLDSLISNRSPLPPPPLPRNRDEMVSDGWVFSNKAPCKECGEELDWWTSPKKQHLPVLALDGIVHLGTCAQRIRASK
jgi:hypothetical protein